MAETETPRLTEMPRGDTVQSANGLRCSGEGIRESARPKFPAYDCEQSLWGIKRLSVFDTGLGSEIPIVKIGGSRPAESVRRRVVAPPGRYACADG